VLVPILIALVPLIALGPASLIAPRSVAAHWAVHAGTAALAAFLCAAALAHLLLASSPAVAGLPLGLPWLTARFRLDALSAFFLIVVNGGAVAAATFALSYARHEPEPERVLPAFPLFIAAMNLTLIADDAFSFLLSWETMSLTSWVLVLATHREPETLRAGQLYLLMASGGTLLLLLAFGVLAQASGGYDFESIRTAALAPGAAALALVLAFLGTGSKAGLVPLHAWLPLAHPAAPSHVSALMSGVMTKVALYGMVRILFDLVEHVPWWWGGVMMAAGGVTAVVGVLFATMEQDLKRLLAYSTVENIGIVVTGLGLAAAFRDNGLEAAAGLAFAAALLHILNHAVFKSLLFLGAGAVATATGTRDLGRLGGLIHRMPQTAFAMLVGAGAIAALPPLNGFVSEWLLFQAVLKGPLLPQWELKIAAAVIAALLALAAALAATCFVRAFGIAFLGRPRSAEAAAAVESEPWMRRTLLALAGLCLVLGILPMLALAPMARLGEAMIGAAGIPAATRSWLWLTPPAAGGNSYGGIIVLTVIAGFGLMTRIGIHTLASRQLRRAPPWACGFDTPVPPAQYSASSFAQPVRRVFASLLRAEERVDMPEPGDLRPARFAASWRDASWDLLYQPVGVVVGWLALTLNQLQFLTIRKYLSLMFAALVGLLFLVAVTQ
jgi:formate hydrogenlyase subunit 3/multisubunit Na+/H+ antiporter MnhD subunit